MKKYVFGIDIGGTTVKIGFFTCDGVLKDDWEIKTDTTGNGSNILKDIYDSVMSKLKELSIDKDEVEGIGICSGLERTSPCLHGEIGRRRSGRTGCESRTNSRPAPRSAAFRW